MHTVTSFKVRFPEFTAAPAALVQAVLDEAELELDADLWGDLLTAGQGFLSAHKLAISPFGNTAKLVNNGSTTYEKQFRRLVQMVTSGHRHT